MPDLSDTARLVLTSAADRADRLVPLLKGKPPVVALNTCAAQIKLSHIERTDPPADLTGLVLSDATGSWAAFRITDAGLAVIGRQPPAPAAEPEPAVEIGSAAFAEHPIAQANAASWDRSAKGRHERVRLAAAAMLEAWHALKTAPQAEPLTCDRIAVIVDTPMVTAAEMLRSALAALKPSPMPRQRASSPTPRAAGAPSKQDQAIALLARPNGATGPEIEEAMGWQPHTVRGFVSMLGKTRVVTRTKVPATDTERACTRYSISD